MKRFIASASAILAAGTLLAPALAGECEPHWDNVIGQPGTSGFVGGLAEFGGLLYVGGAFTHAGGSEVNFIARWNPARNTWSDVGGGANDWTRALVVFDDGSGEALYVGGHFNQVGGVDANHIARWDGAAWSALGEGLNSNVYALAVFDDGSGPALYAGGAFTASGTTAVQHVARWNPDSQTWSGLDAGVENTIWGMAVWNDGGGEGLYVGGSFEHASAVPGTSRIAKWDGQSWSALGSGTSGGSPNQVNTLYPFAGELYVGGFFHSAGGAPNTDRIARWDGTSWASVGGGTDADWVTVLRTFDDGEGEALYAGGTFSTMGGVSALRIAKWDGSSWSALGGGITGFNVAALAVFDAGDGPDLYVAGPFQQAGGLPSNNIAIWRGCGAPAPGKCPADLTGDGSVGVADLLALLACWGPALPGDDCAAADLTGDGVVGVADLLDLLAQWGECP